MATQSKIIPVILSGGMGTRLWPMSRGNYPKQFLNLSGGCLSLIQETVLRINDRKRFAPPIVICNKEHRFLVAEKMRDIGIGDVEIILESSPRNTAPALAVCALHIARKYENAVMLVLSSDHIISDKRNFLSGVEKAYDAAKKGNMVTFGITPEYPETGFGYIKCGVKIINGAYKVENFVEKPDYKTAQKYIKSSDYLWNSGMFMLPAKLFLEELNKYQPEMIKLCKESYKNRDAEHDFIWLEGETFDESPKLSIDYALMEHTKKAAVVPLKCGWSDAGSWDLVWRIADKDKNGNVIKGRSYNENTSNCYISCEDGQAVATLGIDNLAIIVTKDCVLVADKNQAQGVKDIVTKVKAGNENLIENHLQVFRPWGHYENIGRGHRYQAKRITVKPGQKISLQLHYHRAEHWVIVSGSAKITYNNEIRTLTENQSVYIPPGTIHRIENPGKINLELIEVQSGPYLGEDDIVRFEDSYGRGK